MTSGKLGRKLKKYFVEPTKYYLLFSKQKGDSEHYPLRRAVLTTVKQFIIFFKINLKIQFVNCFKNRLKVFFLLALSLMCKQCKTRSFQPIPLDRRTVEACRRGAIQPTQCFGEATHCLLSYSVRDSSKSHSFYIRASVTNLQTSQLRFFFVLCFFVFFFDLQPEL